MFVSFTIPPRCFSSSFNILPNPLLPAPSADAFLNFAGKGLAQWGGSNGGGSSGWCRGGSRTLAATHIFTIIVCTCAFLCTAELNYTDVSFMKTLQMWAAFHHNVSSASSSWDAAEQQCTNLWTWKKSPVRSIKVSTALPRHPQAGSTDQPSLTRRSTSSLDLSVVCTLVTQKSLIFHNLTWIMQTGLAFWLRTSLSIWMAVESGSQGGF